MRGASRGLEALLCGKFVPARRRRKRAPDDDPGPRLGRVLHPRTAAPRGYLSFSLSPENLHPPLPGRPRIARVPTYLRLPAEGGQLAGFLTAISRYPRGVTIPRIRHPRRIYHVGLGTIQPQSNDSL